jgi:pimeloyl-ACP methyl ester carboxylesterase
VDEGAGPPVLLLHGCPFSSFIWRGIAGRLHGRFRCLAPDHLGLGDTEADEYAAILSGFFLRAPETRAPLTTHEARAT